MNSLLLLVQEAVLFAEAVMCAIAISNGHYGWAAFFAFMALDSLVGKIKHAIKEAKQ